MEMSLDRVLAIVGIILAIVLVVLDKAGKLKGPLLFVLLGLAACMAIPLLFSIPWVRNAQLGLDIFLRRALMIFLLGSAWAGASYWIANGDSEANRKPASVYNLENVTEAIWFGFHSSSKNLAKQFQEIDQNSLALPSGANSINTIDNSPPETYSKAWASTFGKMLLCDPANGVAGSGLTVTVSQHPTIVMQIVNSSTPTSPCRVTANLINAVHGYIPINNAGQHLGYILDLPVKVNGFGGDAFGLRFYMTGAAVKEFVQGDVPQWRSFAIDDPNESIQLELTRKGKEWQPIPSFEELLPQRLTLTTDLMTGGPKVVREFELVSKTPVQFARGDDASATIVWAFKWRRIRYSEEKSDFSGSN